MVTRGETTKGCAISPEAMSPHTLLLYGIDDDKMLSATAAGCHFGARQGARRAKSNRIKQVIGVAGIEAQHAM
ncbi:unnamed protein product [Strongylus vulgaris]|uniref:Uncharacterized protein n=1 Tax=Strongylus vulgaris TaxID=40348 RepID=A0A3P7IJN8_STRVU|nr:unnamed protein product [Strongylus vulgaris]